MASTITVDFNANIARFEAGVSKLTTKLDEVKRRTDAVGSAFTNVGRVISAALVGAGFTAAVRSVLDLGDQLAKLSQKVGMSVEDLSGLSYAADLSGVSIDALQTAMRGLSSKMADAAAGNAQAAAAFDSLGVAITDASGAMRPLGSVLNDIADRFAAMEDGPQKAALAVDLFSRSGMDMIPLLNGGSAGLREMADEAQRLGVIMSTETAKAAESFNDNLSRLAYSAKALVTQSGLIQFLNRITEQLLYGRELFGSWTEALLKLGTLSPFANEKSLLEDINKLLKEREQLQKTMAPSVFAAASREIDAKIATIQKQIEFVRGLDRQRQFGRIRPFTAEEMLAEQEAGFGGGAPLTKPRKTSKVSAPRGAADSQRSVDDYAARIDRAISSAIESSDIVKAREMADAIARLDALFFEAGLDAEVYASAMDRITGAKIADDVGDDAAALKAFADEVKRTVDPIGELVHKLDTLDRALEAGLIDPQMATEFRMIVQEQIDAINSGTKKLEEMDDFAKNAAKNIQDAFADFFFDPFKEGMKGLLDGFVQMVNRMVAEALAAQLTRYLFGDLVKGGSGSGALGDAFRWVGGLLFGGPRAMGGAVNPGSWYLVGEKGPEVFVPKTAGTILPNAGPGMTVVNNFTVSGQVDRRSQGQIAAAVGETLSRAMRRNR